METPLYSAMCESPLGLLLILASEEGISHVLFSKDEPRVPLMGPPADAGAAITNAIVDRCVEELHHYFAGERTVFTVPLAPIGTPFEEGVWQALTHVPYGETCSYLDIANRIDNPKAIRAVGRANGANPVAIVIPCHRVIGSDGSLTGYGGELWRKRWLLDHEARIAGTSLF
jgi:methylated-DNA-[protein]-cysteine S-methyltransferase